MRYKRMELHNHTTESDASITCRQLVEFMAADGADAFALTDHNTISGHNKVRKILKETGTPLSCIYGMEYTTYYGHILCFNLHEYVPWENINLHKPELLFQAVQQTGALAGIAHPFSYGAPFARGCRFEMQISDYSVVDFIEIMNNPEPLHEVNEKGLLLWESLVLKGYKIAMTSGMDLHQRSSMEDQFATFVPALEGKTAAEELECAIRSQKTCISRGPVLECFLDEEKGTLSFSLTETAKPGFASREQAPWLVTLTSREETTVHALDDAVRLASLGNPRLLIPKLYQGDTRLEHLVCVGSVIELSKPKGGISVS